MQGKVSQGWCKDFAIADREEKVCVAGLQHLHSLSLVKGQLREAFVGLVDIADSKLKVTGCALCDVRLGDAVTQQRVYFVHSSSIVFLSLNVYFSLKLVPSDFP